MTPLLDLIWLSKLSIGTQTLDYTESVGSPTLPNVVYEHLESQQTSF